MLVAFGHQRPFNVSVICSTVALLICYSVMITLHLNSIYLYAGALILAEMVVLAYRAFAAHRYWLI